MEKFFDFLLCGRAPFDLWSSNILEVDIRMSEVCNTGKCFLIRQWKCRCLSLLTGFKSCRVGLASHLAHTSVLWNYAGFWTTWKKLGKQYKREKLCLVLLIHGWYGYVLVCYVSFVSDISELPASVCPVLSSSPNWFFFPYLHEYLHMCIIFPWQICIS